MSPAGRIAHRREMAGRRVADAEPRGDTSQASQTPRQPMAYLIDLALRLAAGGARWSEDFRHPHAEYLRAAQRDDGGFAGRQGESDLYYTSFALRGLSLLGALDGPAAERAADFLRRRLDRPLPAVELYSLVLGATQLESAGGLSILDDRADRDSQLLAAIDAHHRDDGGFAKTPTSPSSSTYHTFLACLCRPLLGGDPVPIEPIVELIHSRRRDDGGFVEIPQMRSSGANPTAAAVILLKELGRLDAAIEQDACRFFALLQNDEGGFRANTAIPIADLLSTFTALAVLADLDKLSLIDRRAAAQYARRLQRPEGGFRGGAWDHAADVEYTFYGIGTLALADPNGEENRLCPS
ncbi:MAG: beta-hydroxylase [Pirellulaceae bacterium]|nr:beta-hydroxylase [Pirellulaceae bacterium]